MITTYLKIAFDDFRRLKALSRIPIAGMSIEMTACFRTLVFENLDLISFKNKF